MTLFRFTFVAVFTLTLTACQTTWWQGQYVQPEVLPDPLRTPNQEQITASTVLDSETQTPQLQPEFSRIPAMPIGSTLVDNRDELELPRFSSQDPVTLNIDGMALPSFINEVLGNILGLSFKLSEELKKKTDLVSLRITQAQSPEDFYRTTLQVLQEYGVEVVLKGKILHLIINKDKNAFTSDSLPILIKGNALPEVPASHRPVFQYVLLKVVKNTQATRWLRHLYKSPKLKIEEDPERNAIIFIGPAHLVKQARQGLAFFDNTFMRGRYGMRIEPSFLSVAQLYKQLDNVLRTEGYAVANSARGQSTIILLQMPESNALLAFAVDPLVLGHIREWVETLDKPKTTHDSQGLFFYPVQHVPAKDLFEVISPLLNTVTQLDTASPKAASNKKAKKAQKSQSSTKNSSLVVDNIRNALLYQGKADKWARLLPILKEMDVPPKQLLIEVTIAEVTLTDNESFGVEWASKGINLGTGLAESGMRVGATGLSYTLVNALGQTRAILNVLASNSRINVLSSPRLMVKSGETASIVIGDQVPILTSESSDPNGQSGGNSNVLRQIQYLTTGTNLSVTPIVHAGDRIDIEIKQSVSNALPNSSSGIDSPTINNRSINTKLSLTDGGSVLLGGLIESNKTISNNGVPVLKDIPVVGQLFGSKGDNTTRRELIMLIIPYVLHDAEQMQDITKRYRDRLQIESPYFVENPLLPMLEGINSAISPKTDDARPAQ